VDALPFVRQVFFTVKILCVLVPWLFNPSALSAKSAFEEKKGPALRRPRDAALAKIRQGDRQCMGRKRQAELKSRLDGIQPRFLCLFWGRKNQCHPPAPKALVVLPVCNIFRRLCDSGFDGIERSELIFTKNLYA
jgi:hypothetical protein